MGTVTAIGPQDPNRWANSIGGTSTITGTSLTTVIGTRASIAFDTWEVAVGAAMVAARSSRGVRVNRVGAEWVVSWDAPVAYNPVYPTYPQPPGWWQNPYVTYSSGNLSAGTDRTNGAAS